MTDEAAYARSSFALAFRLLPREQREALEVIYAFCRTIDDIVDEGAPREAALAQLAAWREELRALFAGERLAMPLAHRLVRVVRRFPVRREDFEAVIEGCEWDAEGRRYRSWEDLVGYCERVASAVGFLCIEVFGYRDPAVRRYARHLGIALQLTNILRDLDEDAGRGRLYLPLEDLAAMGVSEAELLAGSRAPAVLRLLALEAERARGSYRQARAAISDEERARLPAAEVMAAVYAALLERLIVAGFSAGTRLSSPEKLLAGLGCLLRLQATRVGACTGRWLAGP